METVWWHAYPVWGKGTKRGALGLLHPQHLEPTVPGAQKPLHRRVLNEGMNG